SGKLDRRCLGFLPCALSCSMVSKSEPGTLDAGSCRREQTDRSHSRPATLDSSLARISQRKVEKDSCRLGHTCHGISRSQPSYHNHFLLLPVVSELHLLLGIPPRSRIFQKQTDSVSLALFPVPSDIPT